jgi:large subunit ribosomal protein L24
MKIKKGDQVLIISGKDNGKKGKVVKAVPGSSVIVVEGLNMVKKHRRPRKAGEKGQMIHIPSPINVSNVKLICPKCGKAARIGYKSTEERKYRICKKCGQEI